MENTAFVLAALIHSGKCTMLFLLSLCVFYLILDGVLLFDVKSLCGSGSPRNFVISER